MKEYIGKYVRKRNGGIVPFNFMAIYNAIVKAVIACGGSDFTLTEALAVRVVESMNSEYKERIKGLSPEKARKEIHGIEEIQNLVITALIKGGHDEVGLAYINYRIRRADTRVGQAMMKQAVETVDAYAEGVDENIKENANMGFSIQGLHIKIAEEATKAFYLSKYPEYIGQFHQRGDFHIHDMGFLGNYCQGHDLKDLLVRGFNGVAFKVSSGPAKHFLVALLQLANFMFTMQGESAGAQAVSSFDTLLAPFVRHDGLTYKEVKGFMQTFIYNMNVSTRVGFQTPFTNITMDVFCPENMAKEAVVIGGEYQDTCYGEYQVEMDMINQAFAEVMMEGDENGRIFSYPIPTYNVTERWDSDEDDERLQWPFKMAAKYGIPYFSNFINSDMNPEDVRSMCCRIRLDNTELRSRGGGLFGSNPLTGSIGVVTLNLPLAAYEADDWNGFLSQIAKLIDAASESLEIKRKIIERYFDQGLYPYSRVYLDGVKARTGEYLSNHFSTIGLVGMHEALLNLGIENGIASDEGKKLAVEALAFMRDNIQAKQIATGNLYNLEATPAENTCFRLAKKSRSLHSDIFTAGTKESPYFTNSSNLPVGHTDDVFDALEHQDELQAQYTGGTVFHAFLAEKVEDWRVVKKATIRVFKTKRLPYLSWTPTFSICQEHGYLDGEQWECPTCGAKTEVWSRVTGFYRPVQQYNDGKVAEFHDRNEYNLYVRIDQNQKAA